VQRFRGGLVFKAHRLCVGLCRMSDKKRAKKALPGLLSLVNSFLESKEQGKAAKALRKGVETEVGCHPGGNPGANRWFLQSTPIQMPPESGGICGRFDLRFATGLPPGWPELRCLDATSASISETD